MPNEEVVYTPASLLRAPRQLLRAMGRDLGVSLVLGWRLFVRDLAGQYRQSLLGWVWVVIPPLASAAVFAFLHRQGVLLQGGGRTPYLAFVLTGLVFWQAFIDALRSPLRVLGASRAILTKVSFPREALVLAAVGDVSFKLVVRAVPLAAVIVWQVGLPPLTAALVPLPLVALVVLGLALGLFLVPVGLLYGDVERGLGLLAMLWLFVTPVLYPPPASWPASLLVQLNPVSPLLVTARDLVLSGASTQATAAAVVAVAAFGLLLIAWVVYRLAMPHLVARLSA